MTGSPRDVAFVPGRDILMDAPGYLFRHPSQLQSRGQPAPDSLVHVRYPNPQSRQCNLWFDLVLPLKDLGGLISLIQQSETRRHDPDCAGPARVNQQGPAAEGYRFFESALRKVRERHGRGGKPGFRVTRIETMRTLEQSQALGGLSGHCFDYARYRDCDGRVWVQIERFVYELSRTFAILGQI